MKPGLRLFIGLVVGMVAAVIAVGLYVAGSPGKERDRRFDEQRVNELQQIASAIDNLYDRQGHLAASLDELKSVGKQDFYVPSLIDPKTGGQYEYRATGERNYELCATFDDQTQVTDQYGQMRPAPVAPPATTPEGLPYPGYRDWTHGPGRKCFALDVDNRPANQACALTNPCQAGQTCAQLPNRKGTYCVPQGKECLAAGCPQDKCVIMESYPVQVRCTTEAPPESPPPSPTRCILMQEKKTGKVNCYGCGSKVCKDPAPGWQPYVAPKNGASIPYACFDNNGVCALAQ